MNENVYCRASIFFQFGFTQRACFPSSFIFLMLVPGVKRTNSIGIRSQNEESVFDTTMSNCIIVLQVGSAIMPLTVISFPFE